MFKCLWKGRYQIKEKTLEKETIVNAGRRRSMAGVHPAAANCHVTVLQLFLRLYL